MKFEEKSYIDRCLDVVVGRDGKNFTFLFASLRIVIFPTPKDGKNTDRKFLTS